MDQLTMAAHAARCGSATPMSEDAYYKAFAGDQRSHLPGLAAMIALIDACFVVLGSAPALAEKSAEGSRLLGLPE